MTGNPEIISRRRSGAGYDAHSYHTKVPPAAISELIQRHVPSGGRIGDAFCGSGSTGIGAALAEATLSDSRKYDVMLGDLSPYATFIAQALNQPPARAAFEDAAADVLGAAKQNVARFWRTRHRDGRQATVMYVIWSEVLRCPKCSAELVFWDVGVDLIAGAIRRELACSCGATFRKADARRVTEATFDPLLLQSVRQPKRIPVQVVYELDGDRHTKAPDAFDLEVIAEARAQSAPDIAPTRLMLDRSGGWGDLYRSGYHEGITHVHHFYTWRNFLTIGHLWNAATASSLPLAMRLLVSSYNLAHSTLMSRIVFKRTSSRPVLTGYQTGTLYISALPVEKNPLIGIRRKKVADLQRAFDLTRDRRGEVEIITGPAQAWAELDGEIDYAFLDPPFGGNIPYAEANFIAEAWLGKTTNQEPEATMSRAQDKSAEDYRRLLAESFDAVRSRLTPAGTVTVMFHSADAEPWDALADALADAGLAISDVLLLDKVQGSFKQVRATGAVAGDLLINARVAKGRRTHSGQGDAKAWLAGQLEDRSNPLSDAEKRLLLSRYIASCVESSARVAISASRFYEEADALIEGNAALEAA